MSSDRLIKIARKVMQRVAVDQGVYGLSREGLDLAQASSYIDEAAISLNLALACEIAAQAEEVVEQGRDYTARVTFVIPSRIFFTNRAEVIIAERGFQGVYDEIQSSTELKKAWRSSTMKDWRVALDFAKGIMPATPREEQLLSRFVYAIYEKAPDYLPNLHSQVYNLAKISTGLLREMGLDVGRGQLSVDLDYLRTDGPWFVEILLNGEPFYREDMLRLKESDVRNPSSFPGESFLEAQGDDSFKHPFLGSQDTTKAADELQKLNAGLNHPLESVRSEAGEWLRTSGQAQLFRYMITDNSPTADLKAVSRGLIKRILKDYDNATFDETRTNQADRFFGKDLKMLLAKCWNKSDFKTNFGAFDLSPKMKEAFLAAVGRRINPLMRGKDQIESLHVRILTDAVLIVMMGCALRKIAPQAKFDYDALMRLRHW
jgi:hypothetical protein